MKMSNDFPTILNCYFSKHLKLERRFSSNTYISYLTVLKQYIHFLNSELNISNKKISMTDFEKNNAQFKKIVALSNLIQRIYHNDIRNMLP